MLGLLGKHAGSGARAAARASATWPIGRLLYYAELFLGAEEEALGNRDAARVAYEQAAELYPTAQSPLLALSQLARRSAIAAARCARSIGCSRCSEETRRHDDPWWWYYVAQARDADELLDAMRRPYLAERVQ